MPRATFPPTPASSTEIRGKSGKHIASLDVGFSLPPAAIPAEYFSNSSSTSSHSSGSFYRPVSPTSPVAVSTYVREASQLLRERPASSRTARNQLSYELPPPPTRSRKIIQMKPKARENQAADKGLAETATKGKGNGPSANAGKGKKGNGTTAAGKKTARKTAHSLIERRRRSKMNEEFGTLKNMIPACVGQDMHKLAILQASIEYMRYLERCIADLKTAQRQKLLIPCEDTCDVRDESMTDAVSPTCLSQKPLLIAEPSNSFCSTATSPAILACDEKQILRGQEPDPTPFGLQQVSFTSPIPSTATSRSVTPSSNRLPSPVPGDVHCHLEDGLAPQLVHHLPTVRSELDLRELEREDCEATAALLMLNADRRSWSGGRRGMSVRDLLNG